MEGTTLIDQDGNTHCMEKDSDETVEVKCIEDDEGKFMSCFQKHVSKSWSVAMLSAPFQVLIVEVPVDKLAPVMNVFVMKQEK